MASVNQITSMIAAIKTIYPYYAKETDVQMLVKTWGALLKEYPDEAVKAAFYKCLQTCKMPPTPADVIEQLNAIKAANEPSDEELWNEYTRALREGNRLVYYFRFTAREANGLTQGENARRKSQSLYENLPDKIKSYLGGYSEFIRMSQNYDDEELKFERNRFLKQMPILQKRKEYAGLGLLLGGGDAVAKLPE